MTEITEAELRERLSPHAEVYEAPDWDDVIRRSATVRPRRRRVSRRVLIAVPALLLAAVGVAAATGVLPLGSVIRDDGFSGGEQEVNETVVATGSTPASGRWRITTFDNKSDLSCLKAELLDVDPRSDLGRTDGGYCGPHAAFDVFTVGGKADAAKRGEVILFGTAPAEARSVRLTADGAVSVEARTQSPPDSGTSFWLIAAAPRLSDAKLEWIGQGPRDAGGVLDVSSRFEGPVAATVVLRGTAPVAGPWRLSARESERGVYQGDVYEPEGLPCLDLFLADPPDPSGTLGSGACGELRLAPGFFRGQTTIDEISEAGRRIREILFYGRAPDRADRVEIVDDGRSVRSTEARQGPAGTPGRYWFMALPPELSRGKVLWVDDDTGQRGPGIAVLPP